MNIGLPIQNSLHNRNGRSQATDESPSCESSVLEKAQSRVTKQESTQPTELERKDYQSEEGQSKHEAQQNMDENVKGYLNKDYRDLLNSIIEQAAGTHAGSGELDSSYTGSSYWTSQDKEAFFHALAIRGRDDIPGISKAVQSKNEIDVRSYLLALQNACHDEHVTSPGDSASTPLIAPAANEIGERCEHALNLTAEVLERHVHKRDIARERKNFGNLWLIDEDLAAQIELHQQQKSLATAIDDEDRAIEISDDESSESESEDQHTGAQSMSGRYESAKVETVDSANLLKPEAFLQLSRVLFMNSASDPAANWAHLEKEDVEPTPPAIFRSAFDSFGIIAINFTRWLVQATMFQAMSRLRAKDDQNPTAIVTTEDVRAAVDFLNLKTDWKKCWARVARRNCVKVYSESDKYRDGRPGTKHGRLLTYDEVETELGFTPTEVTSKCPDGEEEIAHESSPAESSIESTDASGSSSDKSEDSSEGASDAKPDDEPEKMAKRKRSTSISSEDEDERLNIADEKASRAEERRLMRMLRFTTPSSPEPEAEDSRDARENSRKRRRKSDPRDDWRSRIDYIAAWEQQRIDMETSNAREVD